MADDPGLVGRAKGRGTIACTGVRELAGFEVENLSRVPGDAWRSAKLARSQSVLTIARISGITLLVALLLAETVRLGWGAYRDVPAAAFVVGGTIGYLLLRCDSLNWYSAFSVLLSKHHASKRTSLESATRWFDAASKGAFASGFTGAIINLIGFAPVRIHGWDSFMSNGVAVSLLYLLYGTVISQFCMRPLADAATSRASDLLQ